jgi:prepilin-type N-terminal cleavage/methylation domain-containing protein
MPAPNLLFRRLAMLLIVSIVALILVAGLGKALDLPAFADSLETWSIFPSSMRLIFAVAIPATELFLAAAWIANRDRVTVERCLMALLALFAVVYWLQLRLGNPPTCQCFGVWEKYLAGKASTQSGVIRSAVMCATLAAGSFGLQAEQQFFRNRGDRPASLPDASDQRPRSQRNAFTLLETLLVIVILSLLLALLAPSLEGLKRRGFQTKDLASLHSNAAILLAYSGDWRDSFPAFFDPKASQTILYFRNGRDTSTVFSYFESHSTWHYALADGYFGGEPFQPFLFSAEATATSGALNNVFTLSCTLFAQPEYWNLSKRLGRSQLGPTHQHDVAFPASKIILYSGWEWQRLSKGGLLIPHSDPRARVPVSRGDGSATLVQGRDIAEGVASGDGPDDFSFHFTDHPPGAHTIDGVRGRDLP